MGYLTFTEVKDTGKTKVYSVNDIGIISWYAPWRRYTLQPNADTIWDVKCLTEVNEFINKLMEDRNEQRRTAN